MRTLGLIIVGILVASCGSTNIGFSADSKPKEIVLLPADYQTAAVSASLTLTRKRPTNSKVSTIVDQATYEVYLQELLKTPDFVRVMVRYHQELFSGHGRALEESEPQNDAAIVGAYAATTDGIPYSEMITADYCIQSLNGVLGRGECRIIQNLTRPPRLAGVLTDPTLMSRDFAAQWVRNAARANERFLCIDPGTPPADIGRSVTETSPRYGGEMFGIPRTVVSQGSQCFECHGALTNRSVVFRNFTSTAVQGIAAGSFDATRTMEQLELGFLYVQGNMNPQAGGATHSATVSTYNGVPIDQISDLGREMAKDPLFDECSARRFYNWVFAKDIARGPVATDTLQFLIERFTASNRNVRDLIFGILSNKEIYLNRFHQAPTGGTTP